MKARWLVALGMLWATAAGASADRLLAGVFQDHMVVQRDRPIEIWGEAAAGAQLSVLLGGHSASAIAAGDGAWRAQLPAMPAGGPHRLVVRTTGGLAQVIEDVLVGDVWLCSGQSNMVLQVHRALDSRAEIAGATDARIRMLTVAERNRARRHCVEFRRTVEWQVTVARHGREVLGALLFLRTRTAPHGRRPAGAGERVVGRLSDLELDGRSVAARNRRTGRATRRCWRTTARALHGPTHAGASIGSNGGARAAATHPVPNPGMQRSTRAGNPCLRLDAWETWGKSGLDSFNGMVWFQTSVTLTAAQAAQSAVLHLGGIEDVDQTFVNGHPIGNTAEPGALREYPLPIGTLRAGANVVLINVLDTYGTGGLHGPSDRYAIHLADGTRVPLEQAWRYHSVDPRMGYPPRAPWEATGGLTTIANAMIAPLGRSSFRGVLWYQGESDVERADGYARRLTALMGDWRGRFGEPLPFLVVQLAAYGSPATMPVDSRTALLRDEQRRAVDADPQRGAGGHCRHRRTHRHPSRQQAGGCASRGTSGTKNRLWRAGLPSGPQPQLATRRGDTVVVQWRTSTVRW